jgi:transposase InsO family protein
LPAAADLKRPLVEPQRPHLSIRRQCEPLGLSRSSYDLGRANPRRRGLEFGHYVCAVAAWLHVPDRGDRLVQPVRALLAPFEYGEGQFCLEALDQALARGRTEIFNADQGFQFTAQEYADRLEEAGIAVSRDGRGWASDNVFVEPLWRSVKYEDIYIKDYEAVPELESGLAAYFRFYNEEPSPAIRPGSRYNGSHAPPYLFSGAFWDLGRTIRKLQ